jgi:4a-hydroxytetrahydrobiopterin dehydratase
VSVKPEPIGEAAARAKLVELPGWQLDGQSIHRQFTFSSFPDAIGFVVRLGFVAEAADHHPDILVNYRRVTLTYTTHSAKALTQKDFDGATAASTIARSLGAADAV